MKKLISITLSMILLVSCAPALEISTATIQPTLPVPVSTSTTIPVTPSRGWWQDAVFYEIFVRSFNDSNADGIGDFNGITQKLDYLQNLGVTAIWLMPIHPSPSYHGYDVINYYNVNPAYGSMADFKNLLAESHKRGIRIIIDLVLNHTSSQSPWFVDANNNPLSPYRDWYIWSDSAKGKYWHPGKTGNYFGFFTENMPDLNYLNPKVTAQMEKIVSFWLNNVGIDGFRMDAAKHLIENGDKIENTPATHEWLKGFYTYYKTSNPEAYIVGEVVGAGGLLAKTYSNQLDEIFNFELAAGFMKSANEGSNLRINTAYLFTLADKPDGLYATFLTNHDQNRVMSVMNGDINKAKIAASLLLTAQGTPFIYYGEEVGMMGQKPDEDIRLPMQWTGQTENGGFSTGIPWRAPGTNVSLANVATEEKDPKSLLNHYRALILLRKNYPTLRSGSTTVLQTSTPAVFACLRSNGNQNILVLINLSDKPLTDYKISTSNADIANQVYQLEPIFGDQSASPMTIADGKIIDAQPLAELAPHSTNIFLLK